MRACVAGKPADRVSSYAMLTAGLLCGASVFFVALPLAQSSPFPTPKDGGWIIQDPPRITASPFQLASASTVATVATAPMPVPEDIGQQAQVEWEALTAPSGFLDAPVVEAALAPEQAAAPEAEQTVSAAPPPPAKKAAGLMDEVDDYLWEVYQREPVKKDGAGDFTWKDPAAAKRVKMSLQDYVIRGMDRDFREQLYHAGKAMDEAGLQWTMLSAFRDDYRQSIAAGYKAATGNSLHGGSRATGGYGHGRAADVTSADGDHGAVWRWLDRNGAKYGLIRPMPGNDPAHIQPRGDWHRIALKLRDSRVKLADGTDKAPQKTKVAKAGM